MFKSSEVEGKLVRFDWIKPFDKIAYYASRQSWLPLWDGIRTHSLDRILPYPTIL